MNLSIIVTSYKNPDLLKVCLNSIRESLGNFEYELIVADSETEERTELMMREDFPDVKFFPFEKNVGFQALLKKGIEESEGEHLLLLNGDIIVTPGSVEALYGYLVQNPSVGIVGPKLLNFNNTLQHSCFRFYEPMTIVYRRTLLGKLGFAKKHLDWFLMKDRDHEKILEADWLMGSALMVSRKALEKVGLMDPRFFMYMEDVDWCRRFWENGYKVVFYPNSSMHHYHGKVSGKKGVVHSLLLNKYTWIHIISAIRYFNKYRNKPLPRSN
ncbi:MAG: Glycosyltransferase [Candidatus Moranbacteria bacterium GW2011_GWE1_49_15]|nr:MAG: Glycosyltransferase [Candidatus Moranbacteria bacterium GW2011_GWE2_47_10]KKW07068.1 MAG: Glycosyltransferase [Candidatus Moranbacteria bacterium GW2011_GWE1_49_15]